MIIQSNFKDYYDRILNHSERDPKILYHRLTKALPQSATKGTKLTEFLRGYEILRGQGETTHVGIILIAGKIHPVEIQQNKEGIFSFNYKNPYRAFQPDKKGNKWHFLLSKKYPQREATWGQTDQDAAKLNLTYGPVLLLVHRNIHIFGRIDTKAGLTANPPLGVLRFPMNSHQLIQNIMAFLGAEKPHTITSTDAIRAQAHGLNQSSFRREKGGPTRKRKKHHATAQPPPP
jgi:hypothetical protein